MRFFPLLEKHFHPRVVEVLCRHTRLAEEEESFWRELLANQWQALCASETPSRIALDRQRLLDLHPALQRRLLRLAIERLQGNLQGIYAGISRRSASCWLTRTPGRSIQLPRGLRAIA